MSDHQVQRTLVKSPPELWAEVSDAESLGRRLEALGEIAITGTEPETTVAWEGENVSGTVALEPSGWGTKVTIEATLVEAETPAKAEPEPEPDPEPEPTPEPVAHEPAGARGGFFARLFGQGALPAAPAPAPPEPVKPPEVEPEVRAEEPEPEPESAGLDAAALEAALEGALDSLGAAHHRPFSRS